MPRWNYVGNDGRLDASLSQSGYIELLDAWNQAQGTGPFRVDNAGNVTFHQLNGFGMLNPSGDTTGATDVAAIQSALNTYGICHLAVGTFYINATIELPFAGAALVGAGGQDFTTDTGASIIYQASGSNLSAMVASHGWLENTNTSSGPSPCLVRDVQFNGNTSGQSSGSQHGLVLQTFRSHVVDCTFNNIGGNGVFFTHLGQNGTTALTNASAENRIERCQFRTMTGKSITSDDVSSALFTDGFIVNCVFGSPQSSDAINIAQAGGWLVQGCHLYGLQNNGIVLAKAAATRVIGNYIETWGLSSTLGTYAAIALTSVNATTRGNAVHGNTIFLGSAPGPGSASSTIYGIQCTTAAGGTGFFDTIGNEIHAGGTPATDGILFANGSSGSTLTYTSTGNNISGFTTAVGTNANSGTLSGGAGS